ncbi:hypothetical protein AAVH_25312 [Aphelenchoides avenae]|nr:hypothetical protein AAVH_25312 [Aphelenchus avenae]
MSLLTPSCVLLLVSVVAARVSVSVNGNNYQDDGRCQRESGSNCASYVVASERGGCAYSLSDSGMFYEQGQEPRPLRANEKSRLADFKRQMAEYNRQVRGSAREFSDNMRKFNPFGDGDAPGMRPFPDMPKAPCLCASC